MSPCDGMMGTNVTNIHFHGTNIAPTCGQDEVIHTLLQPGQSFDYTVQIPSNEPPGLYWYHPHPHGISEGQVQGGASGALIVEGIQNVDPAIAGLPERTLVIRDQNLPASEVNDANIPAWDLSINYVPVAYPSYTPATIQTNPGQQELWRVVNAAADTILNLQFIVNGTAQTLQVVSIDGYPIAAGSSGQTSENETSILLGPGARAEFVVTTPNIGDQAQLVTGYWNTGPDGDSDPLACPHFPHTNNTQPAAAVAVGK
jgi:FtsP/CotA-like multicopper oxidase with cupredoxin domain